LSSKWCPKNEWQPQAINGKTMLLFMQCVTIHCQLPKLDPMGTDDVAIDLLDDNELDEKKPSATDGKTNKNGKPMGAFPSKTNLAEGGQEICHG
jgi:hypothetical protein